MKNTLKILQVCALLLLHVQVFAKAPNLAPNQLTKPAPTKDIELSHKVLSEIGHQIFLNETGGNEDFLIAWNSGESFASLGIGHFIWFPKDLQSPFTETFPDLVDYMRENDVTLPSWLMFQRDNPWNTLQEFEQAQKHTQGDNQQADKRMRELKDLLLNTFDIQLAFILQRMQASLPLMLAHSSSEERAIIGQHFTHLRNNKTGVYSLVDYVNFKGEGTSEKERYKGQGWGLKQVLLNIDASKDIHDAFADACYFVLKCRVENSTQAEVEKRWLPGWKKRCDSYRDF